MKNDPCYLIKTPSTQAKLPFYEIILRFCVLRQKHPDQNRGFHTDGCHARDEIMEWGGGIEGEKERNSLSCDKMEYFIFGRDGNTEIFA